MATKRRQAPIEAGAVETEQHDDSGAPGIVVPAEASEVDVPAEVDNVTAFPGEPPATPKPTQAALTGPQLAEIRMRNSTVDRANEDAKRAQDEAFQKTRVAQYAQEALTTYVGQLIAFNDLDEDYRYRVDFDRGLIVPVAKLQTAQAKVG